MFTTIREIRNNVSFNFISRDNDLLDSYMILHKTYGYKPLIKFQSGRISCLYLILNKYKLQIETHSINKESIDSQNEILVDCAPV